MKIAKAIEILLQETERQGSTDYQDFKDATLLGIEAMKRIQFIRQYPANKLWKPLPSETSPEEEAVEK